MRTHRTYLARTAMLLTAVCAGGPVATSVGDDLPSTGVVRISDRPSDADRLRGIPPGPIRYYNAPVNLRLETDYAD